MRHPSRSPRRQRSRRSRCRPCRTLLWLHRRHQLSRPCSCPLSLGPRSRARRQLQIPLRRRPAVRRSSPPSRPPHFHPSPSYLRLRQCPGRPSYCCYRRGLPLRLIRSPLCVLEYHRRQLRHFHRNSAHPSYSRQRCHSCPRSRKRLRSGCHRFVPARLPKCCYSRQKQQR